MPRIPLIGVTACRQQLGKYSSHTVGDKYVEAAAFAGLPVLLPALGTQVDSAHWLDHVDGLFFTGSPSNVEPSQYNGASSLPGTAHDPHRDRLTLPLLKAAIAKGVPVFCICRGFQELNVALGGTLHQRVQDLPGFLNHREPESESLDEQYAPRHLVEVVEGGMLQRFGVPGSFEVNSLHSQGIDRLAPTLRAEAVAPDGLVEAVSVSDASGFAFGVQWHPEWQFTDNPVSLKMFEAFRDAVAAYVSSKD